MPKQGDRYTDENGRDFTLLQRVDPMGIQNPPYWRVATDDTGHESTIREDRLLTEYDVVRGEEQ